MRITFEGDAVFNSAPPLPHAKDRKRTGPAAAALRRVLSWPARVAAARRTMAQLARMSDVEMHDIGLARQDTVDSGTLL
jgi:uncharacterized protein YjiS (DUF1127 family)